MQGRRKEISYRIITPSDMIFDNLGFHAVYTVSAYACFIQAADGIKFFTVGNFQTGGKFRVVCRQLPCQCE